MADPTKNNVFSMDDIHIVITWVLSGIQQPEYIKHAKQKCETNAPGLILTLTLILQICNS